MITNVEMPVHHRFAHSAGNITIVSESVAEDPHLDLHLHPYKVHHTQQLKPADYSQRCRYAEWVLEQQTVDSNFSNNIFFNDEAYFTFGGYNNKQNCRIWSFGNSQVLEERPLNPEKGTVGCALWSQGMIGPYIFEKDDGTNVTVSSERYGHMIVDFFACC